MIRFVRWLFRDRRRDAEFCQTPGCQHRFWVHAADGCHVLNVRSGTLCECDGWRPA